MPYRCYLVVVRASKTCTRCGEEKPLEAFHRDKYTRDGRRSWCATCAIKDSRRYQREIENAIKEAKSAPCADCGNTFPYYVMDLDHTHGEKSFELGYGRAARSLARVLEELEKCEAVCANCHRERTHRRNQYVSGQVPVAI